MQDVPKIVLKRLQETAAAGAHPDADILTAFAEKSLVEPERTRVIEHLAHCSDCREVVAFALPATESVAVTAPTNPSRAGWLSWPALRWSFAVAGIIAIASVGILQYRLRHNSEPLASNVTRNETAANAVQAFPPPSAATESQSVILKGEKQAETRTELQSSRTDNLAADRLAHPLNRAYPAAGAMRGSDSGGVAGGSVGSGSSGGLAPKAALSSPRNTSVVVGDLKSATPEDAATPAPSPSRGQALEAPAPSQTVQVESEAAPVTVTAENQVSKQIIENQREQPSQYQSSATLGAVEAKDAATASSLELASVRWSISADGGLQRSFDGGTTWLVVNPGTVSSSSKALSTAGNRREKGQKKDEAQPRQFFRAVSVVGTDVWAGGLAAMLYHSADAGAHWTRILPSSSGTTLTGDIISIEFSDPQHGRIATSSGEAWITADDGQTWHGQ